MNEEDIENILDSAIADKIEDIIPKYIFREQYFKCLSVFKELFYWTEDPFYHQMTVSHKMALYYFLIHMYSLQKKLDKRFDEIYFDCKCHKLINELGTSYYEYDNNETLESCVMYYYNVLNYVG